ncbi:FAD/NAD(P)-binding domain-containing protein [Rhizophagus irregularis]|uniref:FAD/NAD(P)-binding domain-containing protein n=1 Tax=Rhizophagus irregularis TaxID=588596 RepID=A0A2N1MZQ1_9GLOM|nr:FAD/NAD(P)-binding domain-containing protein [Rhizophagus irregularis]
MQQKIPTIIIVGAGLGGLTLYHALIKNKDKKEFNVKIFDRESSPQERWQGYHIGINNYGARSLINCVPSSIALNLPKAIPNSVPNIEYHGFSLSDHMGNLLLRPPTKQAKDVYEVANISVGYSIIVTYRDKLRHVLLENVPVQWGKKCIGYEETNDGVWVLFEDGSKEFCDILVGADDDVEHDKIKVDDNDPASVVDHVKYMIRKLRPECEMTDILLELWNLVPKTTSKTYNPVRRRKMQDIDPLSVNAWTSNRITLLGDAIHATSPVLASGANNAIQDAEVLSKALLNYSPENYISCIKEYENEMKKRSSAEVLKSRHVELKQTSPVGYIGSIFRNNSMRVSNFIMNLFDYNFLARKN